MNDTISRKSHSIYVTKNTFDDIERLANNNGVPKSEIIANAISFLEEVWSDKSQQYKMMKDYLKDCVEAFHSLENEVLSIKQHQQELTSALIELAVALKKV